MRIEIWRKQQGMTQLQLGQMLGVSGVTVHRWEHGQSRPAWKHLDRLRQITGGAVLSVDFENEAISTAAQTAEAA